MTTPLVYPCVLGTTSGKAGTNSRDIQLSAFRNVTQYANSRAVVHLHANTVYRQYRYVLPMHVHQALCAVLDFCFFSCIASRGRKGKDARPILRVIQR